ncbi:hypothetical protein MBLNU230_g3625t1 [Neophaeotheca triangularis]
MTLLIPVKLLETEKAVWPFVFYPGNTSHAMTTKLPSGCISTASRVRISTELPPFTTLRLKQWNQFRAYALPTKRQQSPKDTPASPRSDEDWEKKAAITRESSRSITDPINPPISTLPPPLHLPKRGSENLAVYLFRLGKTYGTFYKDGVKAVWFNHKAAKEVKARLRKEQLSRTIDLTGAAAQGLLTRAELQLLARNTYDIGKLPFFGLLVLLFGEWLPLLVPFIPYAVPGTCRIPKQVRGMREKEETRRTKSFRMGIREPFKEDMVVQQADAEEVKPRPNTWPATDLDYTKALVGKLRDDQLFHLSSSLNLHSTIWDKLQLPPPSALLRRLVARRLQYLALDDMLLVRSNEAVQKLVPDELAVACEERGVSPLAIQDNGLREVLKTWLRRQDEESGEGKAMIEMLFRRPNTWDQMPKRGA